MPVMTLVALSMVVGCSAAGDSREVTPPGRVDDSSAAMPGGAQACQTQLMRRKQTTLKAIDIADKDVPAIPHLPRPSKGDVHSDPVYGNCVMRVTDHAKEPPVGFARHDYSRRQAFNADGSRVLIAAHDGAWHLYDAKTMAWQEQLDDPAGDAEIHWHPTNPDLLYFQPTNGVGMVLYSLDVSSGRRRTVAEFGDRLKAIWPTANTAWTKAEGAPSADGRYWCFMVDDPEWKSLGVFTWDMQTDTILGTRPTHGDRPDHVSMSPSGSHCVVSSDTKGVGTKAWTRDFRHAVPLHHKSEHSDLAIDARGRDVYVSIDYQSSGGDIFMVDVDSGKRTTLFSTYLDNSTTAVHFSGRAFKRPGWVLMSTYAADGKREWLHEKIMAVSLEPRPQVKGLAYHHGSFNGYWTEPQATVNPDFTRVLFNSNWGSKSDMDVDNYMVVLPDNALK